MHLHGTREHVTQLARRERLDEVAERPKFNSDPGAVQAGAARHEHHGYVPIALTHGAQQVEPAVLRNINVCQHHVEMVLLGQLNGRTTIRCGLHTITPAFEHANAGTGKGFVIVHHQHQRPHVGFGRRAQPFSSDFDFHLHSAFAGLGTR